jgi:hypothetical protein
MSMVGGNEHDSFLHFSTFFPVTFAMHVFKALDLPVSSPGWAALAPLAEEYHAHPAEFATLPLASLTGVLKRLPPMERVLVHEVLRPVRERLPRPPHGFCSNCPEWGRRLLRKGTADDALLAAVLQQVSLDVDDVVEGNWDLMRAVMVFFNFDLGLRIRLERAWWSTEKKRGGCLM